MNPVGDPRNDLLRLTPHLGTLEDVGLICKRDPALLAAVMLRETWAGWAPGYEPPGDHNGKGDHGHGRGLFQIDDRGPFKHLIPAPGVDWPVETQAYAACEVLEDAELKLRAHFPSLPAAALEEAMLCAYNAGVDRVGRQIQQGLDPNLVTTGRDYGRNVLARRAALRAKAPDRFPSYPTEGDPA